MRLSREGNTKVRRSGEWTPQLERDMRHQHCELFIRRANAATVRICATRADDSFISFQTLDELSSNYAKAELS